jgi:hypothetical protein
MLKRTVKSIRTTAGTVYITGRMDGKTFIQDYYTKYYKKKKNALRSIKQM